MEPVKQKKTPQQQLHTENEIAESGSDYDHDDFEKDEIPKDRKTFNKQFRDAYAKSKTEIKSLKDQIAKLLDR